MKSATNTVSMNAKTKGRRDKDLPLPQKRELYQRAACMCEFENCGVPLFFDLRSGSPVNNGDFAHIIPSSANGPRGSEDVLGYEIDSPENRILLCKKHHVLVDSDERRYPAALLRKMKKCHEDKVRVFQSMICSDASIACVLTAKIKGLHEIMISDQQVNEAIVANGNPLAEPYPRRMNLVACREYGTKEYWQSMSEQLEEYAGQMISFIKSRGEARLSLSVFPLAPIPIIAKFASLIGDKVNAEVFPKLRGKHPWTWRMSSRTNEFSFSRVRIGSQKNRVALVISATAPILEMFLAEQNYKGDVYHISALRIGLDPVKTHKDLSSFRNAYQCALSEIQRTCGSSVKVDVFPCVPNVVAFELGYRRMPKVHPEMTVYENCCGWKPALVIGDRNEH